VARNLPERRTLVRSLIRDRLTLMLWFVASSPLHHCLRKWKVTCSHVNEEYLSHISTLRYLFS
jgi:hypothetical protein